MIREREEVVVGERHPWDKDIDVECCRSKGKKVCVGNNVWSKITWEILTSTSPPLYHWLPRRCATSAIGHSHTHLHIAWD